MPARSRSRGGGSRGRRLIVLVLVAGLLFGAGQPATSFISTAVDRGTSANVSADASGLVALDTNDGLTAGSDQRLVNTTNNVGRRVSVTVSLANTTYGDLQDADETGDSVSYQLDADATGQVDLSLNCEPSVGESVQYTVEASDGGFSGSLTRSASVDASDCVSRHLVWTETSDSTLRSRTVSGTVYDYDDAASVVGRTAADLDGDGVSETPYVRDSTTDLRLVDRNNETSSVLTSDIRSPPTHLWVGSWNGSGTAVFYVNSSDNDIYRVQPGSAPIEAVGGIAAETVAGAGDIDGDGDDELVYTGTSQTVKYAETDGTTASTGVGVGKNNGVGVGEPADFDADGADRVPIVDGSNAVHLLDASGNKQKIVESGAAKTFLAPFDWETSDSQPEVTFVDSSSNEIEYVVDVPSSALTSSNSGVNQTGYYAGSDAGVA